MLGSDEVLLVGVECIEAYAGRVEQEGLDDPIVPEMPGEQPRDHECHKGHIWCDRYLNVLEHLSQCEEDVAKVHEDENEATDASKVESVRQIDEGDSNNMVGDHLVVVLPGRFGVEDQ
jgi:hypothetical protein